VAIKALEAADAEVEQCAAAVAEVDDRVQRHATLTVELAELSQRQQEAKVRGRPPPGPPRTRSLRWPNTCGKPS